MMENIDQLNIKISETLFIKPEYKIDKHISGNKYRKLKYNLKEAKNLNLNRRSVRYGLKLNSSGSPATLKGYGRIAA